MVDTTIPQRTAIRGVVPGTYDPLRRPGSSGQRYFSDIAYVDNVEDPAAQRTANLAEQALRNEQAAGLQALNLSNLARQQRPAAQTLTDEEVIKTFTDIQNNPAYNTERKQIGQSVGAMNRYNVSPERASSLMNVPLSDVNEMMGPYYRASGETKPEGIANLLSKQTELVSEAGRRFPIGMTPTQRSVTGALTDAPNDMVAKLIQMGIFTPETAAQFYQSRYPGLTDGEFVIPADVVSHLGNGNSDAGAQNLYNMMERVRKARTGNPEQGRQIDPNKYLG